MLDADGLGSRGCPVYFEGVMCSVPAPVRRGVKPRRPPRLATHGGDGSGRHPSGSASQEIETGFGCTRDAGMVPDIPGEMDCVVCRLMPVVVLRSLALSWANR